MSGSPALARVAKGRLCAGCGACAALAPGSVEMVQEPEGWLRPAERAPLGPAEEAAVAAACPGLGLEQERPAGATDDPMWGPLVAVRTGWAADPALRHAASSGGALSALLVHLLETGEVEFVLQTAADPENPTGNRTVLSRTAAEVRAASGSRYAPSAPLAGIGPLLDAGRPFAFVGKPCDVAALRAMARRDPRVDRTVRLMASFFCAGVPSRGGALKLLARMGADPAAVTAFRYRGEGWPGEAKATLADGSLKRMTYHESWGGVLSAHVQFRCKLCADGAGGAADLACADAWETDAEGYPRFAEAEGISLIVARTARGEALVRAAEAAGRIVAAPSDPAAIAAMQPGQTGRRAALAARLAAVRLLGRPAPRYRGFGILRVAGRGIGARALLRNFLGTLRRVAAGRY